MSEMVKLESLDFTLPGVTALSNVNSNFGSYSLPFLSDNYDQAHALLDGEYGDVLKGLAIDSGYKIVGWGDLGSVQITNNVRPINSLADMKGINMRCPNEEVSLATFQALGCVTTTLAFSELYLGLSQGVVDGQYNPIDAIYQNSFTEVQDYLAVVNIYIYGIAMIMNNSKFDSMSAEDQQIILDGAAKAQEVSREYCATADADYMQKVIDENCFKEITYPDNTTEQVEYTVLPFPTFQGGEKIAIQRGNGLVVARSTPEKEQAAAVFLKWFTAPEQNMRFVASTGYLPVTRSAFEERMEQEIAANENVNIQKLLRAAMTVYEAYRFYVPPVFDAFNAVSSAYAEKLQTAASEARQEYLSLLEGGAAEEEAYRQAAAGRLEAFRSAW